MSYNVRIAVDFDNTIVCYDELFVGAARERALIGAGAYGSKQAVRDALRQQHDGESKWQAVQADVYGELIERALPFAGVEEFFVRARELGAHVAIVSHKTPFAAARPRGANLRAAARAWLARNALAGNRLVAANDVYFESTRRAKIERIRALGAQIVIDDLVEIFADPAFPPGVRRWLFAPGGAAVHVAGVECFASWSAMRAALEA